MISIREFGNRHPRIVAWIALAVGMVIILLWAAKDVGLLPTQLLALSVATVVLAGLCVWIIGWEDDDEPEEQTTVDASERPQKS